MYNKKKLTDNKIDLTNKKKYYIINTHPTGGVVRSGFMKVSQKFSVTGMTCSACSASVEKAVRRLDGIDEVNVNLLTNSMIVEFDNEVIDDNRIINAVIDAGYGASLYAKSNKQGLKKLIQQTRNKEEGAVDNFNCIFDSSYVYFHVPYV